MHTDEYAPSDNVRCSVQTIENEQYSKEKIVGISDGTGPATAILSADANVGKFGIGIYPDVPETSLTLSTKDLPTILRLLFLFAPDAGRYSLELELKTHAVLTQLSDTEVYAFAAEFAEDLGYDVEFYQGGETADPADYSPATAELTNHTN